MRRHLFAWIMGLFVLFLSSTFSAELITIDISKSIELAVANSFDIKIAEQVLEGARLDKSVAFSSFLPKIIGEYRYTESSEQEYFVPGVGLSDYDTKLFQDFGGYLSQMPSDSIERLASGINGVDASSLSSEYHKLANQVKANYPELSSRLDDMSSWAGDTRNVADWLSDVESGRVNEMGRKIADMPIDMGYLNGVSVFPESRQTASLGFDQVLFSDKVVSTYKAAGQKYKAATLEQQARIHDVIAQTCNAYIDYLAVSASYRIAADNLKTVEENLKLARHSSELGTTGPEDVLRLEAEKYKLQSVMMIAKRNIAGARLALNLAMGLPPEQRWKAVDITMKSKSFKWSTSLLDKLLTQSSSLRSLHEFVPRMAKENSFEIKAFESMLMAQRIIINQKKRSVYLPEVGVQGIVNNYLDDTHSSAYYIEPKDDLEWMVSAYARISFFEGGKTLQATKREKARLNELQLQLRKYTSELETSAHQILYSLQSSRPAVLLAAMASERSMRNLQIIRDKYEQGAINLTDLMEAQNAAFTHRQGVEIAVYQCLRDLVRFQRIIGWFEFVGTVQEKEALERKFLGQMQGQ